jgi:putative ABC transport system substrate-binding protein
MAARVIGPRLRAAGRRNRRQLLPGLAGLSLYVAGLALLAGCGAFSTPTPSAKVPRIGYLSPAAPGHSPLMEAFREGLRELGYVEGQNIELEYRWAEERNELLPELAAELARLQVAVIVATSTSASQAAKSATATIPIVMTGTADPIGAGLVASLARPGGNVTGVATLSDKLGGKRVDLLKEAFPGVSRIAVLWNPTNPAKAVEFKNLEIDAQALRVEVLSFEVRKSDDFEYAFEAASRAGAEALVVLQDPITFNNRGRIIKLAAEHRLPAMYDTAEYAYSGGLLAYGASLPHMFQRAAYYVDRILKGTNPANLPVEQPALFNLVINLRTAHALGFNIPQQLLLDATDVVR